MYILFKYSSYYYYYYLSSVANSSFYADLPIFPSPSLITGDSLRPDLVLVLNNASVYVLELTVGFESNVKIDSDRKATKYRPLINHLHSSYSTVIFVNLSMSAIGIFGTSCESFLSMLTDLQLDDKTKKNALLKTMNIAVRCTYYIFCRRKKIGHTPLYLPFKMQSS